MITASKYTHPTTSFGLTFPFPRAAGDGNYGQNIGAGFDAGQVSNLISNMFYNDEINNYPLPYGQENPAGFESWGHFSQMVWSETTSVGCYTYDCSPAGQHATQDCDANGKSYLTNMPCSSSAGVSGTPAVFTVCNYYPAGEKLFQISIENFVQCD